MAGASVPHIKGAATTDNTSLPSMIATHLDVHVWCTSDGSHKTVVAVFPKAENAPARGIGFYEDHVEVVAAMASYGATTDAYVHDQHANNIVSTV